MKTIIAGSRGIQYLDAIEEAVRRSGYTITELVSGGARGVDRLGEQWARKNGVPIKLFLPEWDSVGKSAGFVRNLAMAEYADALIAIWDGKSNGTRHMIQTALKRKLKVFVYFPFSDPTPEFAPHTATVLEKSSQDARRETIKV